MGLRFDDVGGGQHHIRPIPLAVHAGQCELALRPSQGEPAVAVLVPPVVPGPLDAVDFVGYLGIGDQTKRRRWDWRFRERENTSPPVASTRSSRSKTPAEEAFRCSRMAWRTLGLSGNRLSRKLRGAWSLHPPVLGEAQTDRQTLRSRRTRTICAPRRLPRTRPHDARSPQACSSLTAVSRVGGRQRFGADVQQVEHPVHVADGGQTGLHEALRRLRGDPGSPGEFGGVETHDGHAFAHATADRRGVGEEPRRVLPPSRQEDPCRRSGHHISTDPTSRVPCSSFPVPKAVDTMIRPSDAGAPHEPHGRVRRHRRQRALPLVSGCRICGVETLAWSGIGWSVGFMEDSMAGLYSPNGSGPFHSSGSFRSSGISS